jgi:hypothetical protein
MFGEPDKLEQWIDALYKHIDLLERTLERVASTDTAELAKEVLRVPKPKKEDFTNF